MPATASQPVFRWADVSAHRHPSQIRYLRWCVLALLVMFSSSPLASQTISGAQPQKPLRFDVTPLVGYRTRMVFPTTQDGQDTSPNLIFEAKPSYGFAFGVRLDEENLVEFRWARQRSHMRLEDAAASSTNKVLLDQFHGDFTHEYILDEWPRWVRPFVMGSIGATHADGESGSFTRFSFGLGAGVKAYFGRHFGLRVQGEWLPLIVSPTVTTVICAGGCVLRLSTALVSQGEFAVGPTFRF